MATASSSKRKHIYIIGGGTAACAFAGTLLAKGYPKRKITLLEAGPRNCADIITNHQRSGELPPTRYNWKDVTQPQEKSSARMLLYHSGKVVGGGSSINGALWTPGFEQDYDNWKLSDWKGEDMTKLYKSFTLEFPRFVSDSNPNNVQSMLQPTQLHGVPITEVEYPMARSFVASFNGGGQEGEEAAKHKDAVGNELGVMQYPRFNARYDVTPPKRMDAFTSFLANHDRVDIRVECLVLTLILAENSTKSLDVKSILVFQNGSKVLRKLPAGAEVVLCAGAVRTPHILMLSGIGNSDMLRKFLPKGTLLHPLDHVGQHLHDHVSVSLLYECKESEFPKVEKNILHLSPQHHVPLQTAASLKALLTTSPATLINTTVISGFFNLQKNQSGATTPDYQVQSFFARSMEDGSAVLRFGLAVILPNPLSEGSITLLSNNPLDPPAIQPNYLSNDQDLETLIQCVMEFRSKMEAIKGQVPWLGAELTLTSSDKSTTRQYVQENIVSYMHPTGTCRMSDARDQGVCDPKLQVWGISNLHIVDNSIMPQTTSTNTNATAMMIGVKAASYF